MRCFNCNDWIDDFQGVEWCDVCREEVRQRKQVILAEKVSRHATVGDHREKFETGKIRLLRWVTFKRHTTALPGHRHSSQSRM